MRQRLVLTLGLFLCACAGEEDTATADAVSAPLPPPPAGLEEAAGEPTAAPPITAIEPAVEVIAEDVAYGATADHNLTGYLVLPADAVDVPAIIMIHEWWGLNDDIRAMARRLAGDGYAVLAIDLFAGETARSAADAEALMSSVMGDRNAVLGNIRHAYNYFDQFLLAPRIGVLGWGLGGAWALEAGLELGSGIDAIVMYYGRIYRNDSLLAALEASLLAIFAENDESVAPREVQGFRSQLRELGKDVQVVIYPEVEHGFLNPSGNAYAHDAAEEAWVETTTFLDEHLR